MRMNGKFVFVTGTKKEVNGKVYCRATIEADNQVCEISCEPNVFDKLKKYQAFEGIFDYIVYHSEKGTQAYLKLAEVK